jgi:hypothetical protein
MIKIALLLWALTSTVQAEELNIQASVGDRVSHFNLKVVKGEYLLTHQVNEVQKNQVKIGKKNFEVTKKKLNELLSMKSDQQKDCERDASFVEYKTDAGKPNRAELCYLADHPKSKALRELVNLLLAAVN